MGDTELTVRERAVSLVRHYWMQLIALVLFAWAVVEYVQLGAYEEFLMNILAAFIGLSGVIGAEEWETFSARRGVSSTHIYFTPEKVTRVCGFAFLLLALYYLRSGEVLNWSRH